MASCPRQPLVKSAVRVLTVLQLFERWRRPATAKEVSATLGMPVSSTSMLLRTMLALGYLEFDAASRCYFPGIRVAALSHWLVGDPRSSCGALFELTSELASHTGELVAIGMRRGLFAQYVHVVPPAHPSWYQVPNGAAYPLVQSTCGWALLAPARDDEVSRIVVRSNAELGTKTAGPRWVLDRLQQVRKAGYAFSFGQVRPGAGAVSVHLPPEVGEDVALVVGGNGRRFIGRRQEYLHLMRDGISRYFGTGRSADRQPATSKPF